MDCEDWLVRGLSAGWATDLAVWQLSGSQIEDRGDHLVVRTASNPDYHWGNCLVVLDPESVHDGDRWASVFAAEFPWADWLAVGLSRLPKEVTSWRQLGAMVEVDEVLTTTTTPAHAPLPVGYHVRRLAGTDWEAHVRKEILGNTRSGQEEPGSFERFIRARVDERRALSDRNEAAFFGAFADTLDDEALVADLGIVVCGLVARYQSVATDSAHRGRGLASHLLRVAAAWSATRGCTSWVIITESTNAAGRVYRRAGFQPTASNAQAYRPPPR